MQAFEITEPTTPLKKTGTEFTITREIPIVVSPRSIAALKATDEEIRDAQEQEDGLFRFELTVVIDPVTHVNGHRDVDDVSVEDYVIVGLEDFELGASDASMLRDTLGELTDNEERNIKRDVFFDV